MQLQQTSLLFDLEIPLDYMLHGQPCEFIAATAHARDHVNYLRDSDRYRAGVPSLCWLRSHSTMERLCDEEGAIRLGLAYGGLPFAFLLWTKNGKDVTLD